MKEHQCSHCPSKSNWKSHWKNSLLKKINWKKFVEGTSERAFSGSTLHLLLMGGKWIHAGTTYSGLEGDVEQPECTRKLISSPSHPLSPQNAAMWIAIHISLMDGLTLALARETTTCLMKVLPLSQLLPKQRRISRQINTITSQVQFL